MENSKSNPYYDLDHLLRGNVPKDFFIRCVKFKCSEIKMSEAGIQEVIDLYEARKLKMDEDSLINVVLRLISNIAIREELPIIDYDKYLEMKKRSARESLIGQEQEKTPNSETHNPEQTSSSQEEYSSNEWIRKQFEAIGLQVNPTEESSQTKKEVEPIKNKTPEIPVKEIKIEKPTIQRQNKEQDKRIQINRTSRREQKSENSQVNVIVDPQIIKLEDISTQEGRDKLIVNLINEGKTLSEVAYKGQLLSDIDNKEIIAFINLLRGRIEKIASLIPERVRYNFTAFQGKDIKRVLKWIGAVNLSSTRSLAQQGDLVALKELKGIEETKRELKSTKELFNMALRNKSGKNSKFIGIMNDNFKGKEDDMYQYFSMCFIIENCKKRPKYSEEADYQFYRRIKSNVKGIIDQIMEIVKSNDEKSNEISE